MRDAQLLPEKMEVNFTEYDRSRKGFEFPWDITLQDTGRSRNWMAANTRHMLCRFDVRLIH